MKMLILAITLTLGFSVFADEIPVPSKVVMINNPTLNGVPFAAIFAHDYKTDAEVGGVDTRGMAANSARFICMFMGFNRVYTYSLRQLDSQKTIVLFVDQNLVASPVSTEALGEFTTSVFSSIGCFKNNVTTNGPY